MQDVYDRLHALPGGPLDPVVANVDHFVVCVGFRLAPQRLDVHHGVHVVLDEFVAFCLGQNLRVKTLQHSLWDLVFVALDSL